MKNRWDEQTKQKLQKDRAIETIKMKYREEKDLRKSEQSINALRYQIRSCYIFRIEILEAKWGEDRKYLKENGQISPNLMKTLSSQI